MYMVVQGRLQTKFRTFKVFVLHVFEFSIVISGNIVVYYKRIWFHPRKSTVRRRFTYELYFDHCSTVSSLKFNQNVLLYFNENNNNNEIVNTVVVNTRHQTDGDGSLRFIHSALNFVYIITLDLFLYTIRIFRPNRTKSSKPFFRHDSIRHGQPWVIIRVRGTRILNHVHFFHLRPGRNRARVDNTFSIFQHENTRFRRNQLNVCRTNYRGLLHKNKKNPK